MTESSSAPLSGLEVFSLKPCHTRIGRHYHLRYPVAIIYDHVFLSEINENHTYFAAIVAVYGARGVKHCNPFIQSQAGSWTYLCLITLRQRYAYARGDQASLSRRQCHRYRKTSPQVHSCRPACGISGKLYSRCRAYLYFLSFHILLLKKAAPKRNSPFSCDR